MARSVGLTDAKVRALPPSISRLEYRDDVVPGLRVRVGTSGSKTFTLRARFGGKPRNYALGQYHPQRFTLAAARELARRMREDIAAGRDPAANLGRAVGDDGRMKDLVELYLEREVRGRKRWAREVERTFRIDILPVIGERFADSITAADVTKLVDQVRYRGTRETPRQARVVYQLLSAFFNWAQPSLGDGLGVNPCVGARRRTPRPAKPRDRLLSEPEIRALWRATETVGEFGKAVRLLLLTGQRRGEVFEATWPEFDLRQRLWTIPADRAKNDQAHRVHLSPAATRVLKTVVRRDGSDLLFPAKGNGGRATSGFTKLWSKLLAAVERELEREPYTKADRFTPHDLRRTVATGMQRLGVRLEVTEAVLNHVSGSRSGIVGVYQRHHFTDEKREALETWAAEVARIARRSAKGRRRG